MEKPFALPLFKGRGQFLLSSSPFVLTASDRQERVKAKPGVRGKPEACLCPSRRATHVMPAVALWSHMLQAEKRAQRRWQSPGCYPTPGCYQECSEQNKAPTAYKRKTSVRGKAPFAGSPGPQRFPGGRTRGQGDLSRSSRRRAPSPSCCLRGPLLAAASTSEAVPKAGCALSAGTNPRGRERPAS